GVSLVPFLVRRVNVVDVPAAAVAEQENKPWIEDLAGRLLDVTGIVGAPESSPDGVQVQGKVTQQASRLSGCRAHQHESHIRVDGAGSPQHVGIIQTHPRSNAAIPHEESAIERYRSF